MDDHLSTVLSGQTAQDRSFLSDDFDELIETVHQNRFYTNHGPLAKQFESELESFLQIDHVVTAGNESLALLIAMSCLELEGEIVVPIFQGILPAKIAEWVGLKTVWCDVDSLTHQPQIEQIRPALDSETRAVVLVETWGNRCEDFLIDQLIAAQLKVIVVAFDSFGAKKRDSCIYAHDDVISIFSFGKDKIVSTLEGGAIATSDEELAHRLRNTRSSYGVEQPATVNATCNGRFSELQAGLGIKSLSRVQSAIDHNSKIRDTYSTILNDVDDVAIYEFDQTDIPTNQCFNVTLNREADFVQRFRNQFPPIVGQQSSVLPSQFPVAARLVNQTISLPVAGVSLKQAMSIGTELRQSVQNLPSQSNFGSRTA